MLKCNEGERQISLKPQAKQTLVILVPAQIYIYIYNSYSHLPVRFLTFLTHTPMAGRRVGNSSQSKSNAALTVHFKPQRNGAKAKARMAQSMTVKSKTEQNVPVNHYDFVSVRRLGSNAPTTPSWQLENDYSIKAVDCPGTANARKQIERHDTWTEMNHVGSVHVLHKWASAPTDASLIAAYNNLNSAEAVCSFCDVVSTLKGFTWI